MARAEQDRAPPYQAERRGARCAECPLVDCHPVGPKLALDRPRLIVIGTHPGDEEEAKGVPFVGSTGKLADSIFRMAGIARDDLHLTNAILCQPPWGTPEKELQRAVAACKPRLQRELKALPENIPALTYGDLSLYSAIGSMKVTEFMGVPIPSFELGRMVLPAWHPAACLPHRNPAWRPVVTEHTARAYDYAEGRMPKWVWPEAYIQFPGVSEDSSLVSSPDDTIIAALERLSKAPRRGVDVETPKIGKPIEWETKGRQLLNVGIASKELGLAVCVTWPTASPRVQAAIRAHLALPIPTVMHNGFFDARIFILNGIELRGWTIDTMEIFRLVAPNIPRGLDTVACIETVAPRWKDDYRAKTKARKAEDIFLFGDPGQRADYCGKDAFLQDYLYPELKPQLDRLPSGGPLYAIKHANILTGLKMWHFGVRVHAQNRENHRVPLEEMVASRRAAVVDLAKEAGYLAKKRKPATKRKPETWLDVEFNPGSGAHVRGLFQHLGAHTGKFTDTGLEQFDAEALTKLAAHPRSALVRRIARGILAWKKPSKALTTYVRNLPVWADGRVHCEWRPGATKTARWASAGPNLQNQPGELRDMYAPDAGCWGLEVDYSQLELRIVALLAGDLPLIEAYAKGFDVHRMNAADIFGILPAQVTPAQRHFAKTFVYGANYGGGAETLWAQIVVDFPDIRVEAIARAKDMWFKAHPAIREWQEASLKTAFQKGFIEEKLSGHRIYTYGQNDPGMILNTPVQGAGAFMVNEAVEEVSGQLDWKKEAILFQVHDSLVVQGPNLGKLIRVVKNAMERPRILNGYEMRFPVDMKVFTNNWGTALEVKTDGTIKRADSESGPSCRKLWLALGEAFEENSEREWEERQAA